MLTLAREENMEGMEFFGAIPEKQRACLRSIDTDRLCEVRLRAGMPMALVFLDGIFYITKSGRLTDDYKQGVTVSSGDLKRGMELITRSSVYAFSEDIKNGFITLEKGHRVGISGDAVVENGKVSHIRSVQSLNYRYAREVIGASDGVMDRILDGNRIKNTLIVSPPMCGKTTMLRDIARNLSLLGKKVSIVDERGEIAALMRGVPSFSLGANCDVLANVNKAEGMLLMLRAMSPDVIITDEIGGKEDFDAIAEIKKRGVSIITSLHSFGDSPDGFDTVIRLGGIGKCLE
ncbi:MAG: stage III sporulation protein AA [Clostridia bacterium]|nr:stage III sporulation protein AA [Clostridia bacterium]